MLPPLAPHPAAHALLSTGTPLVSSLLASMYVLWGAAWLAVAWAYGRAGYASWRVEGGRWSHLPASFVTPVITGLRVMYVAVCNVLAGCGTGRPKPFPTDGTGKLPIEFTPGHRMRWAIFLVSFTPVIRGFYSAVTVSWRYWSAMDTLVNVGGTLFSIMAARNLLFLAYRSKPLTWGLCLLLALFWLVAGPFVLSAFGYGSAYYSGHLR